MWLNSTLHNSLLKYFERNLFFLYENFSFEVTFVQTCIAVDSPLRHSSKTHPRHFDVLVRDIHLSYRFLRGFILLCVQLSTNITKCHLFIIIHILSTHFAITLFYLHNLKPNQKLDQFMSHSN